MENPIIKYERTPHLEGSKLQPGDSDHDQVTIAALRARYPGALWVQEEKLDGANCAASFNDQLSMILQSRGHELRGGARERQFAQFKEWAWWIEGQLMERLENRYVMYGEWTFAKHTSFYDKLPHYFHEFDILDKQTGRYLSTFARRRLLQGLAVTSVPVTSVDWPIDQIDLRTRLKRSVYTSPDWERNLAAAAEAAGVDPGRAALETAANDLAEGFYIKIEDEDHVLARAKFVHPRFLQTILDNDGHWSERPMIRNQLAEGVDLFAAPARDEDLVP